MGVFLSEADLTVFVSDIDAAKAAEMIADAEALAALAAPCILADDFAHAAVVKAILRGAIVRWLETGSGAAASQSAGPYSVTLDTRQERRAMFWPSDIAQLRNLCLDGVGQRAFTIDTTPVDARGDGYPEQGDVWVTV